MTSGEPSVGASDFSLGLDGARAQAPAAVLFGIATAPVTLPSRCLVIASNPFVAISAPTDGMGRATVPLPVAPQTTLGGVELIAQWIVADPGGSLFGSLAASPALRIVIGR